MKYRILLFLICMFPPLARAEEAPDAAFKQWQQAYAAADARVGAAGTLRDALSEGAKDRARMRELADACTERAGEMARQAFRMKVMKDEWESAKKEAKRTSEVRDAKYLKLMAEAKAWLDGEKTRLAPEDERLKQWSARLGQRKTELEAWWARIKPLMRTYKTPDEQAAYDNAVTEKAAYDQAWNAYSTEWDQCEKADLAWGAEVAKVNAGWQTRLQQVETFVLEEGRQSLAAQALASKKERDFHEVEAKCRTLEEKQASDAAQLSGLLENAGGMLRMVMEALAAPQMTASTVAEPYAVRTSDEAARATALPPVAGTPSPALRSRIMVLPPTVPAATPADRLRRTLQSEAAADAIATQYTEMPAAPATPVQPADSSSLVRAPVGFIGPAPVSYAGPGDDGTAVIVLTDEMLHRAFDPRVFISDADYRQALDTQARYRDLVPKLQAQLTKLHKERDKTAGYSAEFENLRAEIARGAVRDLLSVYATASGPLLEQMALDPRHAATLTPDVIKRIKLAFSLVQMEVGREHANPAGEPAEQRKLRLEVLDAGAEALLTVCAGELAQDAGSRVMLEQMGNMLKVYTKTSRYLADPKTGERPVWEEVAETAKLGVNIAAVYCPPVALGVGVESLGERGMQWAITQDAVSSLSASLSSNAQAIVYLSDRLDHAQAILDASTQTIRNYQAVDPVRRRAFHITVPAPPPPSGALTADGGRAGDVEFDGRRAR